MLWEAPSDVYHLLLVNPREKLSQRGRNWTFQEKKCYPWLHCHYSKPSTGVASPWWEIFLKTHFIHTLPPHLRHNEKSSSPLVSSRLSSLYHQCVSLGSCQPRILCSVQTVPSQDRSFSCFVSKWQNKIGTRVLFVNTFLQIKYLGCR